MPNPSTTTLLEHPVPDAELAQRLDSIPEDALRSSWVALIADAELDGAGLGHRVRAMLVVARRLGNADTSAAVEAVTPRSGKVKPMSEQSEQQTAGRKVAGHTIRSGPPPMKPPRGQNDDIFEAAAQLKPGEWMPVQKKRISRTTLQQRLGKLKKELGYGRNELVLADRNDGAEEYVIWRPEK